MRSVILGFLTVGFLVLSGCSTGPGMSPSQIRATYDTPGYVDRAFADMHPDLPG